MNRIAKLKIALLGGLFFLALLFSIIPQKVLNAVEIPLLLVLCPLAAWTIIRIAREEQKQAPPTDPDPAP